MAAAHKTFLDGFLYFINILFALLLMGSYLAYYVPPSLTTIFSFLALGYPVWFIVNLAFAIYWLLRFKVKILLPIIAISIGYGHVGRLYQFGSTEKVVAGGQKLKVMSFNVRLFNKYKWIEDNDVQGKIVRLIQNERPDVLMLQEFSGSTSDFQKELGFKYQHFKHSQKGQYGTVIFSKHPITKSNTLTIEGDSSTNNTFHYADIEWQKKTIRFFNVHLASVGLENEDYKLLQNPNDENQEQLEEGLRSIANNLSNAFKRRELQVQSVMREVRASPHPVVMAGDFNDVPQSFVYHEVSNELLDSFEGGGEAFGKTYVPSPVPLRIDFIFHSESLNAFNFKRIKDELSDHYPITTDIEWEFD